MEVISGVDMVQLQSVQGEHIVSDVLLLCVGALKEYGIRDGDMLLLQRVQGERGQPMAGRQLSSSAASQSSSGHCHSSCIFSYFCSAH